MLLTGIGRFAGGDMPFDGPSAGGQLLFRLSAGAVLLLLRRFFGKFCIYQFFIRNPFL